MCLESCIAYAIEIADCHLVYLSLLNGSLNLSYSIHGRGVSMEDSRRRAVDSVRA